MTILPIQPQQLAPSNVGPTQKTTLALPPPLQDDRRSSQQPSHHKNDQTKIQSGKQVRHIWLKKIEKLIWHCNLAIYSVCQGIIFIVETTN